MRRLEESPGGAEENRSHYLINHSARAKLQHMKSFREKPLPEKTEADKKSDLRRAFALTIERKKLTNDDVRRAHRYAAEGGLYDQGNPEVKSLLEKLEELDEEMEKLKTERQEKKLMLAEVMPQVKDIDKRHQDILELLIASVGETPNS